MTSEYSIDNKYQVITISLAQAINNRELDTLVVSNFLTTFFVDDAGNSIKDGKINIAFNSSRNYGLTFLNGSKYKSQFQKIYISAPAQPNVNVRIFTSVNAFYEKEQPVTNAIFKEPMSVSGSIDENAQRYGIKCYSGNVNNSINTITIPQTIDGRTVLGVSSILITNLDNSNDLFFGNIDNISDLGICCPINAGEKYSIDFKPLSQSFQFSLASLNSVNYQYCVLYTYSV